MLRQTKGKEVRAAAESLSLVAYYR